MADSWDDEPATKSSSGGGGYNDGGRSFSRGRGFSANTKSVNGNDDGGWGAGDNDNGFGGRPRGGGRPGGRGGGGGFKGRNRNDNGGSSWGDNAGADAEESSGGWGDSSGGGGGWGASNDDERPRRGGFRGGRGGGGGRDRGGRNNRNNEGGWGDGGGDKDGGWGGGDTNQGDGWGASDDNGNERSGGRGRGRGGRGGGHGGGAPRDGGDDDGAESKPREIYVPPEPSNDESEIFNTGITSGINFFKYDDIEVKVSGENVAPAIPSFEKSGLRQLLLDNIAKSSYTKPTPIQKQAIPIIMAGRDIMGCAQTGSGKTAAFLLPIIHCLLSDPRDVMMDGEHSEPQAIIVSPTRELAIQIYNEARKFAYGSAIKIVLAYGGTSVGYQRKHLVTGCHILVATPGRMNDFVRRGSITFSATRFVVLDEADRMLDMGFLSNMEEMLEHESMVATGQRQTLMFSATFPQEIQELAARFLENYIFVSVGIIGSACQDVQQVLYQVDRMQKRNKLVEILREQGTEKTLVFVETKRNADFLASYLSENDFQSTSIHGDRLQREREEALRDFTRGVRNILVATAVAARGLDIKNVKHVINYDLPKSIDEYVHRIGRTGRLGNSGKATSFFDSSQDGGLAADLARILKQAEQPVPDWLGHCGSGGFHSGGFGGHDIRDDYNQPQSVEVKEETW